jgi:hypothetical protein
VVRRGAKRKSYRLLVGEPKVSRLHERIRGKLEINNKIDVKEKGWRGLD